MGIVNVTPDSFSDGGRFLDASDAIAQGLRLREEGADLVDVGGESTRPGAAAVPVEEELRRVMPVVEALAKEGIAVSIDTMKPEVMRRAIDAGCAVVNDVYGFRADGALEAVARAGVGVVAMHMQGTPGTMQKEPRYDDVVAEVTDFLLERAHALEAAHNVQICKYDALIDDNHTRAHPLHDVAVLVFLRRGLARLLGVDFIFAAHRGAGFLRREDLRVLEMRHVQLRPRRIGRARVLGVVHDAHDGHPVRQIGNPDAFADRVLAGPDTGREGAVDDADVSHATHLQRMDDCT